MINYNIQALRAFAAYAVVCHHVVDALRNYIAIDRFVWDPNFGSFGVEVFFVISGYIMLATNSRRAQNPTEFFLNRLIRIVPLYWLLTLVAYILIVLGFKIFGGRPSSFSHLVSSLTFMPYFTDGSFVKPIVFVGWTLNYEMMFYAIFALCLIVRPELTRVSLLLVALIMLMSLRYLSPEPITDYMGNEVIAGFGLGAVVFLITKNHKKNPLIASLIAFGGLVGLVLMDLYKVDGMRHGTLLVCILASAIVAGVIWLEEAGVSVGSGWLSQQGDASYALYLIHPFVLQGVGKIALIFHLNDSVAGLVLICFMMIACSLVCGTVLHLFVEKPIGVRLRNLVGRPALKSRHNLVARPVDL